MYIKFTFPSGDYTSNIITEGFCYTQNYYNKLEPADNTVQFRIPFNKALADLLKANVSSEVPAVIFNDDNSRYFTGLLRKTAAFQKEFTNKPVALEIVSGTFSFKKKIGTGYNSANLTLRNCVKWLLNTAGVTDSDIDYNGLPAKTVQVFSVSENETFHAVLSQLLREYKYTFDFNKNGIVKFLPLFNEAGTVTQTLTDGTGGNLVETITINASERQYDGVTANYKKLVELTEQVIFSDTSESPISSGAYFLGAAGSFCDYDSTHEVRYITAIDSWKLKGSFGALSGAGDSAISGAGWTGSISNNIKRAQITLLNSSGSQNTLKELTVKGSGLFVESSCKSITAIGENKNTVNLNYVTTDTDADDYVKALANYYIKAEYNISCRSKTDYEYGSFVSVSAQGQGTITGRIIQKKKYLNTDVIDYIIESTSTYSTLEVSHEAQSDINNSIGLAASDTYFFTLDQSQIKKTADAIEPKEIKVSQYKNTTDGVKMLSESDGVSVKFRLLPDGEYSAVEYKQIASTASFSADTDYYGKCTPKYAYGYTEGVKDTNKALTVAGKALIFYVR